MHTITAAGRLKFEKLDKCKCGALVVADTYQKTMDETEILKHEYKRVSKAGISAFVKENVSSFVDTVRTSLSKATKYRELYKKFGTNGHSIGEKVMSIELTDSYVAMAFMKANFYKKSFEKAYEAYKVPEILRRRTSDGAPYLIRADFDMPCTFDNFMSEFRKQLTASNHQFIRDAQEKLVGVADSIDFDRLEKDVHNGKYLKIIVGVAMKAQSSKKTLLFLIKDPKNPQIDLPTPTCKGIGASSALSALASGSSKERIPRFLEDGEAIMNGVQLKSAAKRAIAAAQGFTFIDRNVFGFVVTEDGVYLISHADPWYVVLFRFLFSCCFRCGGQETEQEQEPKGTTY